MSNLDSFCENNGIEYTNTINSGLIPPTKIRTTHIIRMIQALGTDQIKEVAIWIHGTYNKPAIEFRLRLIDISSHGKEIFIDTEFWNIAADIGLSVDTVQFIPSKKYYTVRLIEK